jgi:hypothetical protein
MDKTIQTHLLELADEYIAGKMSSFLFAEAAAPLIKQLALDFSCVIEFRGARTRVPFRYVPQDVSSSGIEFSIDANLTPDEDAEVAGEIIARFGDQPLTMDQWLALATPEDMGLTGPIAYPTSGPTDLSASTAPTEEEIQRANQEADEDRDSLIDEDFDDSEFYSLIDKEEENDNSDFEEHSTWNKPQTGVI